ncbi:metallophosphoesterase [Nocardiopsis alba]|uniref:metallophosphoesterase n=1 Tax=Nocardiopsis alba TaxID=53437 RepID=UPI0033F585CD
MSALIAHISDLHLDGTEETTRRATRTVDHLRSLHRSPDLLVVSGDIADHGAPEEYEQAAALLDLPFPVLVCPGNHDDRAALRSGLLGQDPSDGPVDTEHRGTGFTVLACDTSIPGRDDGHLGTETLERVRRTLDELPEDIPVLLAMHHPPVRLHHPLPDRLALDNVEDLVALLEEYPRVAGVLAGHAHTGAAATLTGRPVLVAPGVTSTLSMPWETEEARAVRTRPPGIAFHVLAEDASLTTHFRSVP